LNLPILQSSNLPILRPRASRLALAAGALAFTLVATLNSGGYRYGIGDQAFYIPAVVQHLDPTLFPRDRQILSAQDRFLVYDDAIAAAARATGVSVPVLFFIAYLAAMLLLFGAIVAIGTVMYQSWWSVATLAALMTLRHRITKTGVNSLEGYFHPRMLAFAIGAWAVAACLRGKSAAALALVAVAFAIHPTTAMWFGIWIVTAVAMSDAQRRLPLAGLGVITGLLAAWLVMFGPLRGHLVHIDPLWASAMSGKDYIFPSDWNASFWMVNLGYLVVAVAIQGMRRRRGTAIPREAGLLWGAAALVILFLASWPLMSAGVALALQLQTSRIFWMLDLLAAVYIAWLITAHKRSRQAIAIVVIALALGRGLFVWRAERQGAPAVRIDLPQDSWTDVMRWVSRTAADAHVLAHPGHAWKYGTSVRVSGERDVYLEEVKDLSVALYSRDVAIRSLQRIRDAENFDTLTPDRFRALAARYDLDYLVLDRDVNLPIMYRNEQFRVYALQPGAAPK
jgi:hypothetical protein